MFFEIFSLENFFRRVKHIFKDIPLEYVSRILRIVTFRHTPYKSHSCAKSHAKCCWFTEMKIKSTKRTSTKFTLTKSLNRTKLKFSKTKNSTTMLQRNFSFQNFQFCIFQAFIQIEFGGSFAGFYERSIDWTHDWGGRIQHVWLSYL